MLEIQNLDQIKNWTFLLAWAIPHFVDKGKEQELCAEKMAVGVFNLFLILPLQQKIHKNKPLTTSENQP